MFRFNQFEMKNLKSEIQKLLRQSIVISSKQRDVILENLENFSNEKLQKLFQMLQEALEKQREFIKKAIKKNPSLLNSIGSLSEKAGLKNKKNKELSFFMREINSLDTLDNEINSL